jgi:site-specific DNA recombinase
LTRLHGSRRQEPDARPIGIGSSQPASDSNEKRAVLYLRVSTPRQMHTGADVDPEGNSIATQREACLAKATSLDASIAAEFVEPGNSAQSIEKRPVFKQLRYIEEHRAEIDHVIVYMRSRAFRNSIDAAITKRALSLFDVRIVSCKEDLGIGPVADAMETVGDAFNELQVRQNGEDVRQKLRHKALNGGTIARAKLGYLNTRAEYEGKLFNSIGLDERRAPLVGQAFELYATGDYSLDALAITLADLGLTTRPSARRPAEGPVSTSKLHRMLADPYYAGWVTVDGKLLPGRHQAIVSQALFDRVQEALVARSKGGNRDRVLRQYLKGIVYCQRCHDRGRTSRLIYTEARGRNGQYYGYFMCRSRQLGLCDLPHLPSWQVEEEIVRHYRVLQLPDGFAESVHALLQAGMADEEQVTRERHQQMTTQLTKLDQQEERLIDLAADGVLTRSKIMERSNKIQLDRVRIQAGLEDTGAQLALGVERLRACLELARDPVALYGSASDAVRQQLNATFFSKLYIDEEPIDVPRDDIRPPFDEITGAFSAYHRYKQQTVGQRLTPTNVRRRAKASTSAANRTFVLAGIFNSGVSSKNFLVELRGLEPLAPSMRTPY